MILWLLWSLTQSNLIDSKILWTNNTTSYSNRFLLCYGNFHTWITTNFTCKLHILHMGNHTRLLGVTSPVIWPSYCLPHHQRTDLVNSCTTSVSYCGWQPVEEAVCKPLCVCVCVCVCVCLYVYVYMCLVTHVLSYE